MTGFNPAEGYAASLRQMAEWVKAGDHADVDECELAAAADFIEQQAKALATYQRLNFGPELT